MREATVWFVKGLQTAGERTQWFFHTSTAPGPCAKGRGVAAGRPQPHTHMFIRDFMPHLELLGRHKCTHQRAPEKKCLLQNNN